MPDIILFESERLLVRQLTMNDLDDFILFNGNETVMRYIRKTKNAEESTSFLEETIHYYIANPQYGRWAMVEKESGSFAGSFMLKLSGHTESHEVGYAFMPPFWNKGYAKEILRAGINYAFNELKLPELVAFTLPENEASRQVLQKSGFVQRQSIPEGDLLLDYFLLTNSSNGADAKADDHAIKHRSTEHLSESR